MTIYVVLTNYIHCDGEYFGAFSSIQKARKAIENFIREEEDIHHYTYSDNYEYHVFTANDEEYYFEISFDFLDVGCE